MTKSSRKDAQRLAWKLRPAKRPKDEPALGRLDAGPRHRRQSHPLGRDGLGVLYHCRMGRAVPPEAALRVCRIVRAAFGAVESTRLWI